MMKLTSEQIDTWLQCKEKKLSEEGYTTTEMHSYMYGTLEAMLKSLLTSDEVMRQVMIEMIKKESK